ncbi:MAG: hypothetical protein OHK0031_14070 [Anaerolineales bacterium]
MKFTTLFFDVDDTLYPADCGLWQAIKARIGQYMQERLGIPAEEIPALRQQYYEKYGTALKGLEFHYPVKVQEYLDYVHDVPLERYLRPQPELAAALKALPARKFLLTNADAGHASRVSAALGLENCFEGVIDVAAMSPYCKPMPEAFQRALSLAGGPSPARCAFFDDLPRSTRAARALGIFSVLVSAAPPEDASCADAWLGDWSQLPGLLAG